MTLIEFTREFSDEESCKTRFRAYREQVGVVCLKCGGKEHYWKKDKKSYECKSCRYRKGLKANTVIYRSKFVDYEV